MRSPVSSVTVNRNGRVSPAVRRVVPGWLVTGFPKGETVYTTGSVSTSTSTAPMSHFGPCGRAMPRWSVTRSDPADVAAGQAS
ncbi:hypothetical protein GCM10022282_06830 [Agromyces indicus]